MAQNPSGIDERPKLLRPPVIKSEGRTASERYLAKLAERSFLNLWSYPNPYRDQRQGGTDKGNGKELCDLLVVCGKHVIIFSEKTVGWPGGAIETAWRRWASKAIRDSAKQTKGAERWISEFPGRLFLDPDCTDPFPIDLPPEEVRQVHRVVVANGSAKPCRKHTRSSSGSLIIRPGVKGDSHWTDRNGAPEPFVIGDVDPEGSFVHVFNEAALEIVIDELDTVTDFADYLAKKAAFVRSGDLVEAHGEENLLAYYAIRINDEGDHDFVVEEGKVPISIDCRRYDKFVIDPRYQARKFANETSYLWDNLISKFTSHLLDGTSIMPEGQDFDLRKLELGVRQLALVPRFFRRLHSEAIADALERGKHDDRFVRVIMSPTGEEASETAFFIQTMKYLDWMDTKGGYDGYRKSRSALAMIYALGLLERHSHLGRVVGISCEPPDQSRESSEDLVYVEQHEWTDQERKKIQSDCKTAGVLQNQNERPVRGQEFPEHGVIAFERLGSPPESSRLNRKQRRALKARTRKRK
ncbi:MAG: hypothetical protein F4213_12255 [Boseongicola sp. SB0677_bin_26]|nr:hypothetical protein [Boseongicola sp. SB0665_bin_10]MYG26776.1 hypothetical protein [Boseongicola sp. SB0677_bin_26]